MSEDDPTPPEIASDDDPRGVKRNFVRRLYAADLTFSPSDQRPEAVRERRLALDRQLAMADATGLYGNEFSAEEMAAARRLAGVHRQDPVAEILDLERGDQDWSLHDRLDQVRALMDDVETKADHARVDPLQILLWDPELARRVNDAFARLADQLREVFDPVLKQLAKNVTEMMDRIRLGIPNDALDAPASAKLRHGSASTCPRHGPTKGGTCLKCLRSF